MICQGNLAGKVFRVRVRSLGQSTFFWNFNTINYFPSPSIFFLLLPDHWLDANTVLNTKNLVNLRPQANGSTVRTPVIHLHNVVKMLVCYFDYEFHKTVRIAQFGKQLTLVYVQKWSNFAKCVIVMDTWLISLSSEHCTHFLHGVAHCGCPNRLLVNTALITTLLLRSNLTLSPNPIPNPKPYHQPYLMWRCWPCWPCPCTFCSDQDR